MEFDGRKEEPRRCRVDHPSMPGQETDPVPSFVEFRTTTFNTPDGQPFLIYLLGLRDQRKGGRITGQKGGRGWTLSTVPVMSGKEDVGKVGVTREVLPDPYPDPFRSLTPRYPVLTRVHRRKHTTQPPVHGRPSTLPPPPRSLCRLVQRCLGRIGPTHLDPPRPSSLRSKVSPLSHTHTYAYPPIKPHKRLNLQEPEWGSESDSL